MSTTVIHGEGLGKRYRRGLQVDDGLRHSPARHSFVPSSFITIQGISSPGTR